MGSYSVLYISDYPILSEKNMFYDFLVNLIFLKEDYVKERRLNKSRNTIYWRDSCIDETGYYTFKGFKQKVKYCKERLEIGGCKLISSKRDFNRVVRDIKRSKYYPDFFKDNITFENYLYEISEIIHKKLTKKDYDYNSFKGYLISNELAIGEQSLVEYIYAI